MEALKYVNYDIERFEVIVVDDCSEKPVSDLIQLFNLYYKIKYIRNQSNLGRAAARNRGAEVAIGDILIFSDGDRIMDPDFIVQHVNQIKSHENVVCIGNNIELYITDEYSCAMKSQFRRSGNHKTGTGNHPITYASLLA